MVSIQLKQKVFISMLQSLLKDLSIWYPDISDFSEYYNLVKAFETNLSKMIYPDFEKKILEYKQNILNHDLDFFMKLHYSEILEISSEYYSKFDLIKDILEKPETTEDIKTAIWDYLEKFLKIAES